MKFAVVTIFPEMFRAITDEGVVAKAIDRQLLSVDTVNPRIFAKDKHRTVDDRPYGGGPGMVMMTEPVSDAIYHAKAQVGGQAKVVYVSPQGKPLTQAKAKQLAQLESIVIIAGRYEGIDQRLIDTEVDEEISIGDFIVSGGELPAMIVIDAVARCLPDVLGHKDSAEQDSFSNGLLDCPHYTRPFEYKGVTVPDVLLSGNHQAIAEWRLMQSLGQTWIKRPELLERIELTDEQAQLLKAFKQSFTQTPVDNEE
ncbi:MAG: tRNA (guanosine(37)-N1)-methyltransferase TrmD [Cellvibrionales bacterium]|nr:tRNA (guanosine(37)-N1)-methyltransferase TrmD [Cellvibrionales bacterium]